MSQLLVDDIVDKDGGNSVGFSKGINVGASSTVTGNLNVTGVLTYEDVTNVDSVGLITARSGIKFGAAGVGGTIRANGDTTLAGVVTATSFSGAVSGSTGTFTGDVDIADKIVHTGDTNTALRFPSADTITAETGGTERTRITSAGLVGIGTVTPGVLVDAQAHAGGGAQTIIRCKSTADNASNFVRSESSDNKYIGLLKYGTGHSAYGALAAGGGALYANSSVPITIMSDGGYINFATGGNTERLKIDSSGDVTIGTGVTISSAGICTVTTGTDLKGFKVESGDVSGGSLNGEFDFELKKGHIKTMTGSTAGTYFPDFKVSSSVSLNSVMVVGDTMTATLIVTASNTAHYCTAGIKIDDSTSNVTVEWIGSSAPSAGKGAGYDIYTFTIVKTAATPAYLVIVNATDAG